MYSKTIIRKNSYYDSVTLMSLGSKIKKLPGVDEVVVAMATEMNKEILINVGLADESTQNASVNDLILAVRAESEEAAEAAFKEIDEKLAGDQTPSSASEVEYHSIDQAVSGGVAANMAVISVPGRYAAREAKKALMNGLHVMLFSDNVPVEKERELKELAREKGLLVMGPDCGTAVINGIGLCFANSVRKGGIGVVGASGTGLQEVLVQIHRLGGGVAQAIGTGGRDLKEAIGGIMMLEGIRALEADEEISTIVLVSKPPEKTAERKIRDALAKGKKPAVVCFLESENKEYIRENVFFADTLYDAAVKAVALEIGKEPESQIRSSENVIRNAAASLKKEQQYVKGLFCGGTLCAEALIVLRDAIGKVYSNISHNEDEIVNGSTAVNGNRLLDLGEDEFTNGRPHPMIEPEIRNDWIVREAKDPATAVILMDLEIGFGSHANPAEVTAEGIRKAREIASAEGREIVFVMYICGTDQDKQNIREQEEILKAEGVILADSNAEAAKVAAAILAGKENR